MVKTLKGYVKKEYGVANMISLLIVLVVLLVASMIIVPISVYIVRANILDTAAENTLKEIEVAGCMTIPIRDKLSLRLATLGMPATSDGYPAYTGTTIIYIKKQDYIIGNPSSNEIKLIVKYPASSITQLLKAIGGGANTSSGYHVITKYGRTEAYDLAPTIPCAP